jgi:hypothetical protein
VDRVPVGGEMVTALWITLAVLAPAFAVAFVHGGTTRPYPRRHRRTR